MERMIHTPEGVRDVYNGECAKKQVLKQKLHQVLHSYGYEDIETPSFEYFDVFSREIGTTPSRELYKFFDKEGNTLALRPDFTPSIVRAVSMYFMEEKNPIRLCYSGSTFQNINSYRGRLREATEMGVEFFGDGSAAADAEVLALVVDVLKQSGLSEFQVSVGEVEFFKAIVEEAKMSEETVNELRSLISQKNYFGVEELIEEQPMEEGLKQIFLRLPQLFGGIEILEEAKSLTSNAKAQAAISRLEEIYKILSYYGCENYISFDLGMLSKYHYYTGIIFQAFTYGTGEAVVKGGRYDHLLQYFGKSSPAIGFALPLENLMNALNRQNIPIEVNEEASCIFYHDSNLEEAVQKAQSLRREGKKVKMIREEEA